MDAIFQASGKRAYLGLLKAQNYDKQTDGSNIFWMTTKTQTLPFEMKDQFVGLITDIDLWGTAWSALGLNDYLTIYDDIKFSYQLFPSYYAICEQG
uniref:Uncharacterized protein n=1 Tax=Plectus sambesii TaxID=2011161 RepID=A0A914WVG7_9BILA